MYKCDVCGEKEATRDGGTVGVICDTPLCYWTAGQANLEERRRYDEYVRKHGECPYGTWGRLSD